MFIKGMITAEIEAKHIPVVIRDRERVTVCMPLRNHEIGFHNRVEMALVKILTAKNGKRMIGDMIIECVDPVVVFFVECSLFRANVIKINEMSVVSFVQIGYYHEAAVAIDLLCQLRQKQLP